MIKSKSGSDRQGYYLFGDKCMTRGSAFQLLTLDVCILPLASVNRYLPRCSEFSESHSEKLQVHKGQ